MILSLIVGFVLGAAAIVFALQNTAVVALSFLGWEFQSSLALLVLITLGVGILISLLVSIPSLISTTLRIMGLKKENKKLVQELEARDHPVVTVVTEESSAPVVDLRESK